jgi:uncharacterized membrane protein YbhN (UPF0104 family)
MRPTRFSLLVLAAVVVAGVSYLVTRSAYDSLPQPGVYALLWLALLAIAETYVAVMTRARLAGRSGTRPVSPLVVARYVALAKASSIVGSLASGAYGGYFAWVVRVDSPTANHDALVAGLGLALSVALVAAAWFLEQVGRVRESDDEDGQ